MLATRLLGPADETVEPELDVFGTGEENYRHFV